MRSQRRRLPIVAALASLVVLVGCGGSSKPASSTATAKLGALAAPAVLHPPAPVSDFSLQDASGKLVRLSQFRGKAVMLTFIYTHCPDVCPLIVSQLRNALLKLGPQASKVQLVAVSVDPKGDTPKTVKAFLAAHDVAGRMDYLIGSKKELTPVWRAYGIEVEASPEQREVGHTGIVYGVTGSGRRAALYPANLKPEWIVHDVPILASS